MMANQYLESLSYPTSDTDEKYLVVMLHGWGATYHDLHPLAEMMALPNCRFLFPNAPFPHFQMPSGRAWYGLETPEFVGIDESRDLLDKWLKSLSEMTGIPPERTAMIGFSQGGAMTLEVGLKQKFAAICSCSGYLHYDPASLSGEFSPTLLIHGNQDQVVPLAAAKQAESALGNIGVEIDYFEFSGGHEIPPAAMMVMKQFLEKHLLKD